VTEGDLVLKFLINEPTIIVVQNKKRVTGQAKINIAATNGVKHNRINSVVVKMQSSFPLYFIVLKY